MSERSDRSDRFGWSAGDIEITKRPPPRDREAEDLEGDIRRLQDKILDALALYAHLQATHGDQRGWEMVEENLRKAHAWAEMPLEEDEDDG